MYANAQDTVLEQKPGHVLEDGRDGAVVLSQDVPSMIFECLRVEMYPTSFRLVMSPMQHCQLDATAGCQLATSTLRRIQLQKSGRETPQRRIQGSEANLRPVWRLGAEVVRQRRGDIVAVLPRTELAAVDVVTQTYALSNTAQAA